ncbi:MAG: ABC transporter permease [Herbinix sp.]|nr:ABC transporter permease [Herbinix sp.]
MGRLLQAELKKLRSLNIWWLVITGGILPGIITYLTFYNQENPEWLGFTNMSLLSFNVQSLLTFATFATYMWAREYEENIMEQVLCYPYPRFYLVLVKVIVLFFVVAFTTAFFFCTTHLVGKAMFGTMMPGELMWKLMKTLINTGIMHFLLIPMYLCIAMVTKISISGLIFGITNMCICMALSHTSIVQYIPQCIPYVIGDSQLGMNSLKVDNGLWVYYIILVGIFIVSMILTKLLADKLKK